MTAGDVQERLAAVGAEVNQAAALLRSPSPCNLDRCSQILDAASRNLASVQGFASPDAQSGAIEEARRLLAALRRAAGLLDSAAAFRTAWQRVLGGMCTGYRTDGSTAPLAHTARISVEG